MPLAEPALLRLRAREDERLDDRADPRRDADLRGADRDRVRAGAAVAEVLARGCDLVRRRRARRGRLARRLLRRPARQPARDRDGGDVGRLLGRDRAADGALHGVADQRRRAVARLGADRPRRLPAGGGPGLRPGLEGVAAARRSRRSARSCVTNVLWFRSLHRIGASRATLVANLQPFVAAVFALVLLSERMTLLQVRRRHPDRRRNPDRRAVDAHRTGRRFLRRPGG